MSPRPPARRGACPAFAAPMETGDGLLMRLVPADGTLTLAQVRGLAEAARAFGNGLLEVSARGSLQVRGLREDTVAALQDATRTLAIVPREGLPIDTSPLCGLDAAEIADARPLARRIRAEVARAGIAGRLGPKVSVVIDGGGSIRLDGLKADVRLEAEPVGADVLWTLNGAGAPLPEAAAAERAVALLAQIAVIGPSARATDLWGTGDKAARVVRERARPPIGPILLHDGRLAVGVGLPFGAVDADTLCAIADAAQAAGARDLRPAPDRVLLACGLDPAAAGAFFETAARLGCLVQASDPRAFVAACPGAPACASAHMPARALAPAIADALAPLLDGSVSIHLSACTKGCAHPAPATLTFVGMDATVALVHEGLAGQAIRPLRPTDRLVAGMAAFAQAVIRAAEPGETARAALRRLDASGMWERIAERNPLNPMSHT